MYKALIKNLKKLLIFCSLIYIYKRFLIDLIEYECCSMERNPKQHKIIAKGHRILQIIFNILEFLLSKIDFKYFFFNY